MPKPTSQQRQQDLQAAFAKRLRTSPRYQRLAKLHRDLAD